MLLRKGNLAGVEENCLVSLCCALSAVGVYNGNMPNLKPRPNHAVYLRVLRAMSPQARLRKAFELSAFTRALFCAGLARRFRDSSATELDRLARDRLEKCHNRNY